MRPINFCGITVAHSSSMKCKRPAIRAFQIRLTHEIVCPLIGKLSGTHDERYGAFRS